jgi:hypothetical protein
MAASEGRPPWFADDLVQDVVERISDTRLIPTALNEMVEEIRTGEFYHYENCVPETYARPVLELGIVMHQQLEEIHAYGPDGKLPYRLHLLRDEDKACDVYLRRIEPQRRLAYDPRTMAYVPATAPFPDH